MISLYVHIPFCNQKCKYCSFSVIPTDWIAEIDSIIEKYVDILCQEIVFWWKKSQEEVRTLYFGGWTPSRIGLQNLEKIIDCICDNFDVENFEELSLEMNPYPEENVYNIVSSIQKKYNNFPRIRRSFGIQTFDNVVLQESGREYSFPATTEFLRNLKKYKQWNTVYNFDFIAFGKFNLTNKWNQVLRDGKKQDFFENFVKSHFADSFSVYTLELFPGSERFHNLIKNPENKNKIWWKLPFYGNEDDVYEEFSYLKDLVMNYGYRRYEISNFALPWKNSLHNKVYREMWNYLGFGTSASSYLGPEHPLSKFVSKEKNQYGIRFTNTVMLADYLKWNYLDETKTEILSLETSLLDRFFLALRRWEGIEDLTVFVSILEKDWENKILNFEKQGFLKFDWKILKLTDLGMDIFNEIITELIR